MNSGCRRIGEREREGGGSRWKFEGGLKTAGGSGTSCSCLVFLIWQVYGVAFSEDGSYFVTSGTRRVRFWYFDTSGRDGKVLHAHAARLAALPHYLLFPPPLP